MNRKIPKRHNECQFCKSTNYNTRTSTCRDCGTTAPANPPALTRKGQTFIYLAPKDDRP
jgi:hypothetical protein